MARVTRQFGDLRIDELPHHPHPGDMVVVAGQQCGTGRRAGGEQVKSREPQTLPGETVECRCADLAAEGTDVAVAEVVGIAPVRIRRMGAPESLGRIGRESGLCADTG
jgi:hypothetical protein